MAFEDPKKWMRTDRNMMLSDTDWTQMPDVPITTEKKAEWGLYRQALRDLPASASPSLDESGQLTGVTWPTKPA